MIKKRKGWHAHVKPYLPVGPRKPEATVTFTESEAVYEHCAYSLKLSEVPVPEGCALSDLTLSASLDADGDITFEFSLVRKVTKPNPDYERQMKRYKTEYEKWKIRKEEHKIELKEWEEWRAQEEKAQLDAQLEHAEQLLRKHGRLRGAQ